VNNELERKWKEAAIGRSHVLPLVVVVVVVVVVRIAGNPEIHDVGKNREVLYCKGLSNKHSRTSLLSRP
jgi:hypothetical protein